MHYCQIEHCLPDEQFGFLPKRSTVWQLLSVVEDWTALVDQGKVVHALFLDVAKAFDRVDHGLLQLKLASIGVQDTALQWFCSYLSNRSNCTSLCHLLL